MSLRLPVIALLSAGVACAGVNVVVAQDYPSKPIRIVTGGPGSGGDFASRIIGQGLAPLGQSVIVDNRGGIIVPAETVSKAPPDGYTLLVTGAGVWILPLLQKAPYDALRDFAPISQIERSPNLLVVHPSLPVKSVKELIALAKAKPGALNYGSVGTGGPAHLGTELFNSMASVNIVRVPYKGAAPAVTALIGGEVQVLITDISLAMPAAKAGRLRVLAVTSADPSALAPGLPTVAASGVPGYEMTGMTVFMAPAKTSPAIITWLNRELVRVLNQADVKEKFLNAGVEVVGSSPERFAQAMKADVTKWDKIIKDAGIKLE